MSAMKSPDNGPAVTGIGIGLPNSQPLSNEDLINRLQLNSSDNWINTRTGIRQRFFANKDEATSDFATRAARQAIERAQVNPAEIDSIIVGTVTGDYRFPATAAVVQGNLGIPSFASAFDVGAACSGGIVALSLVFDQLKAKSKNKGLAIGSETLSRIINPEDRSTAVLFGDGAGAYVVENVQNPGVHAFVTHNNPMHIKDLWQPAGGSREPIATEAGREYIQMDGGVIFDKGSKAMIADTEEVMQIAGLTDGLGNLDWGQVTIFAPHQANLRMIEYIWKKLEVPEEKRITTIDKYGNTSAGSTMLAVNEALIAGRLPKGSVIVSPVAGSGFSSAAAVFTYQGPNYQVAT